MLYIIEYTNHLNFRARTSSMPDGRICIGTRYFPTKTKWVFLYIYKIRNVSMSLTTIIALSCMHNRFSLNFGFIFSGVQIYRNIYICFIFHSCLCKKKKILKVDEQTYFGYYLLRLPKYDGWYKKLQKTQYKSKCRLV